MKTIHDPAYGVLIDTLKRRRKELGLTQQQVANELGVDRTVLAKMEMRERRIDVVELYRLCHVLKFKHSVVKTILS